MIYKANKIYVEILFYIFAILHTLSYTTSILFNITLDYERAGFGLLLILLFYKHLDKKAIQFNIILLYTFLIAAFFSKYISENISFTLGFLLYFNVIYIYWKHLCTKYPDQESALPRIYMYCAIPFLIYLLPLFLNPIYISLDFYTNPNLERLGLKSRTIGWSAACSIPLVFYWARKVSIKRIFFILLGALLIILVIGSGSRSSIIGVSVFIIITVFKSNIKYKIYWSFLSILFSIFIISKSEDLSLTRRAQLQEMGVSDDSFRINLTSAFLRHIPQDFPQSLYPGGSGYENTQVSLNKFFETQGFGTHNTYITIFLNFGILSVIFFRKFFSGLKYLFHNNHLLSYAPFLVISLSEDCFGPGQLLFPILITLIVISKK
ncbi:MAG: hypothetical protein KBD42_07800 [Chitinophagales bacterium]|nr:hypothetical protein [Chitinophagales bacterium]